MTAYLFRLTLLLVLFAGLGCATIAPDPPTSSPPPTYLLHLPGIVGRTPIHNWWCLEVASAVPGLHSEVYDWTGHAGFIDVLQAYERNREQARQIAAKLVERRREEPNARLVLTAESGGTGPAVWALEDLPDGVMVDSVILISPALSPEYDLSKALRHVRSSMHVFNSERDTFILGWGTRKYGTIDGKRSVSAGQIGFLQPESAEAAQYAKLIQVPYQPQWWKYMNFGGHGQALSPSFGKNVIGPLIASGAVRG